MENKIYKPNNNDEHYYILQDKVADMLGAYHDDEVKGIMRIKHCRDTDECEIWISVAKAYVNGKPYVASFEPLNKEGLEVIDEI